MTVPGGLQIRFRRGNKVFHVYGGPNEGREGIHLAQGGFMGVYDAPVRTTWKTGAFTDGSRQKHRKWLHRDMELIFHVIDTIDSPWQFNDSEFRRMFDYELDPWEEDPEPTVLEVETELSGVRCLDVLMYEEPEFEPAIDPHKNQHGILTLKLRAGQPFWYETSIITSFSATTASAAGTITVENPTDQTMHHKWILTRATWTLPDVSWSGPKGERTPGGKHPDRAVEGITVTEVNGGMTVDLDGQELMFRDAHDTNAMGQMAGKFFNYSIPPYTPATDLVVAYEDAPAGGAMVQLVQPRRWSRPWGLELPAIPGTGERLPQTIRFVSPGTYTYTIPEWCDTIDVIALGGGGGGGGGTLFTGTGGAAGQWATATLVRGQDIPWETEKIVGVVGAGGAAGAPGNNFNGGQGAPTTVTADGMPDLVAAGGNGSGNTGRVYGQAAGSQTLNGETYQGGPEQPNIASPGRSPGGGGAGGWPFGRGAPGARGQVWFRAYYVGGS